jgi:hypothetical protein
MSTISLLGSVGSDGGGISIGPNGTVHRIPPYNPDLLTELEAVSQLVKVATIVGDTNLKSEITAAAQQLATAVIPQAVKAAGLQGGAGLSVAFLSDDGDFYCGSTGKIVPVPIPRGIGQTAGAGSGG